MELNWNDLLKLNSPWAYFIVSSENDIDNFVLGKHTDGIVVRIIRGKRCLTKESLLQEWAAALQFPYYFGHNWDAFDECINDLSWLQSKSYIFFITDFDSVLASEPQNLKVFLDILKKASENWSKLKPKDDKWRRTRNAIPFKIVFHCEPKNEAKCKHLLEESGVDIAMKS